MLQLVALVHELVGTGDHAQIVCVVELLGYVLNEGGCTAPNRKPAPRGLSLKPTAASSGSLQSKSEPAPFSGTSWTRVRSRMSFSVFIEGDSPP